MPKRGVAALLLTTLALVLLVNFQTPSDQGLTRFGVRTIGGGAAAVAPSQAPQAGTGATGGSTGDPGASSDGSGSTSGSSSGSSGGSSGTGSRSSSSGGSGNSTTTPAPTSRSGLANGTVTGQTIGTRFGDVQVQVRISGGRIVDIAALQLPFDHARSAEISQLVEPLLRQEALQAQSAQIDVVSGATYTSMAYAQSLQSALDQARW